MVFHLFVFCTWLRHGQSFTESILVVVAAAHQRARTRLEKIANYYSAGKIERDLDYKGRFENHAPRDASKMTIVDFTQTQKFTS